ncbi:Ribosomal protein S6 glutaminyl transferase [hydrothermal vent metagenome]|uniref:Ribosomal protein S6 glutaminyl transferase n=1 Tax=hydrothermal vent metagenome TaxID=652676 RepID=A0A1W1EA99_9ZZZZ
MAKKKKQQKLPKLGLLYLDHVLRFFDKSNFKGWPDKIETVVYHWKNDKERFIKEVKRKKIDVLIGNIPATAYETFREIARELPHVQFIPSLDTQFANKSKENVTRFAWKYDIPVPKTYIFYDHKKAERFIDTTTFPKIIKKSYGPSNYGGYFVHKVDSAQEAHNLLAQKKYHPVYMQDFVPMEADVRVMLIGHKPVCAFWRRPPKGEWLTNTSQGGSMDYMDVPKELLDLAVKVSKAANAEYWACDVAVGEDGKYRILECATAFAAFPYIRDWIGQYLMWKFSNGRFPLPNIPLYNWEELGKMDSSVLRTLRYITFGRYTPSYDGAFFLDKKTKETAEGEMYLHELDSLYPMLNTYTRTKEEWPSEKWNFQDNYGKSIVKVSTKKNPKYIDNNEAERSETQEDIIELSEKKMKKLLTSVEGIGEKKADKIMKKFDKIELIHILETAPEKLNEEFDWFKEKFLKSLKKEWQALKEKL